MFSFQETRTQLHCFLLVTLAWIEKEPVWCCGTSNNALEFNKSIYIADEFNPRHLKFSDLLVCDIKSSIFSDHFSSFQNYLRILRLRYQLFIMLIYLKLFLGSLQEFPIHRAIHRNLVLCFIYRVSFKIDRGLKGRMKVNLH